MWLLYSFEGGAGACPKCGQVVTATARPAFKGTGRSQQERPVAEMNGAGQNGQTAGTWQEWAEADPDSMAGIAITPDSGLATAPLLPRTDRR